MIRPPFAGITQVRLIAVGGATAALSARFAELPRECEGMVRPSPGGKQGGGIGTRRTEGLRYSHCRPPNSAAIHPSSQAEDERRVRPEGARARCAGRVEPAPHLHPRPGRGARPTGRDRTGAHRRRHRPHLASRRRGRVLGAARADGRHPRHRRPEAAVATARFRRRLGHRPQGARLHRRRAGGHAAGQPRVVRGRGGGLAPHRADHVRRPADRHPRVSVADPAGVHAERYGAGAGADRAGGGGGAQCRALRRRRGTAPGDRGVPARGVGDLVLARARDRAPRGGPRAARAPPLRRRPVHPRGPGDAPAAHADGHRDADRRHRGLRGEGRRGRGGPRADGAAERAVRRLSHRPAIHPLARHRGVGARRGDRLDHRRAHPRRRR